MVYERAETNDKQGGGSKQVILEKDAKNELEWKDEEKKEIKERKEMKISMK